MLLTSQHDCDAANTKFNAFHDGFLRELRWQSSMRFAASMPWEEERAFNSKEEQLFATGMTPIGDECLSLFISHYNYDWPNQPNTRLIEIRLSGGIKVNHQINVDVVILELIFAKSSEMTSCTVRWEPFGPPIGEPIPNSEFYAERVTIEELESAN